MGKTNFNIDTSLDQYFSQSVIDDQQQNGDAKLSVFDYAYSTNIKASEINATGVKSLFNEYAVFRYELAAGDNNLLYDRVGEKGMTDYEVTKNPSALSIITHSQENSSQYSPYGSAPYSFADFMYCKYYGLIPNNYLITLRRFPFPMVDNLKTFDGRNIPPIAQAVTWLGPETGNSMKDILKFTFGLNWKDIEAGVQEITGNERGFDESPLSALPGNEIIKKTLGFMNQKDYSLQGQAESDYARELYGSEGPYANKVYGPVNVIHKTSARDRGMHFEHDISLNFHFELKSVGNINPKAAMLDLMSNILTLTYNNAKFWGGAIRYFPQHPRVKFFGDQNKFYSGDVGGYIDSVVDGFSKMAGGFMDMFKNLLSDPIGALKKIVGGIGGGIMSDMAAGNRPQIIAMKSLLTGDPIGEWHLVVGNPLNPIAMIGNLICTDCEFEFSDELGPDDFPVEFTANIKLKHGRPRDKGDIESMFNLGNGRMYFGIKDSIFPSANNSVIDTSGTRGNNNSAGKITSREQNPSFQASESKFQDDNKNAIKLPSMWGSKFAGFELQISKTWADSSKPDVSKT